MPEFTVQQLQLLARAYEKPAGAIVWIASMMKDPPALLDWLYYHTAIGMNGFCIRLEDPDDALMSDIAAIQPAFGERLQVVYGSSKQQQGSMDVMDRIVQHVDEVAMPKARAAGAEYLLHIDSDELFYPVNGLTAQEVFADIHQWRQRGFSDVEENPADILACMVFRNYEARFPHEDCEEEPFTTPNTRFLTEPSYFALYQCGKSAAWLGNKNAKIESVHDFRGGDWAMVPETEAVILHFDCPGFTNWLKKFQPRAKAKWGQMEDETILNHFNYYSDSIAVLNDPSSSEQEQRKVYHLYRCLPWYHRFWFAAGFEDFDIMRKIKEGCSIVAPTLAEEHADAWHSCLF
mmetsp:Transcript_66156/g.123469  ORF Transcript_66156/g.123469 Transcript_66156/m.123469 type:complete len:347 (-) Transcript_66156:24-1064(-)